ncbi:MAG: arylesterase [Burkholderiaceae bacterium]
MLVLAGAMSSAYSASKTVLVLGDSLSAGYGLARDAGWVSLLKERLRNEHVDADVVNASISGETTSGGRTRLPPLLQKYRPSVVVIELGANDALRGLPLDATEANLVAMADAARKAGAKPLIVGMQIPPNYGRDYAQRFAQTFRSAAQQSGSALAPFLLAHVAEKPELFQPDGLHPTSAAQPTLLDNVWPYLAPLLKK